MPSSVFPKSLLRGVNLLECWICYQRFQSMHNYLDQICPHCILTSSTHFSKALRMTLYFRIGDSLLTCAKNQTDPWIEQANSVTLEKESIHSTTLVGVGCAVMKFILVCGDYLSHWDYKCLGDWHITGQSLLGYLTVHLAVLERTCQKAFHNSGFTSFGRVLLPWLGVNVNEAMIRKLSLTLGNTTDSIAKTLASQEKKPQTLWPKSFLTTEQLLIIFKLSKEMSVLWPPTPATLRSTLLGKLKLSYIRSSSKSLGLKR